MKSFACYIALASVLASIRPGRDAKHDPVQAAPTPVSDSRVAETSTMALVGTDYYVKNNGNDSLDGHSDANAWATITLLNSITFQPGDRIFLAAGSSWRGELVLHGSGTGTNKITVSRYGTGARPAIYRSGPNTTANETCCTLDDVNHWIVSGIEFKNARLGLVLYSRALPGGSSVDVEVTDCYFKDMDDRSGNGPVGFGLFTSGAGGATWDGIVVQGCTFDTISQGLRTDPALYHTHYTINNCEAFGGWSAQISLHSVASGRVSYCYVHDMGAYSTFGSTGMYVWECTDVTITDCRVARVHHGGGWDGLGIDFEAGNVDCTVTRCSFYENEGPGILAFNVNTNLTISDCLFYNNNTLPANGGSSPDPAIDVNLACAPDPNGRYSNGTVSNCVSFISATSGGHLTPAPAWNGFTFTGFITGDYCTGWTPVYGALKEIAVGGNGKIVGVDAGHQVLAWDGDYYGDCWSPVSSSAAMKSASIGNDGELWATDTGDNVWRYNGSTWVSQPGSYKKVAVGSASNIWAVATSGAIARWASGTSSWTSITGTFADVDAGPAASDYAWAAGANGRTYRYEGSSWVQKSHLLDQVSAATYGDAIGVRIGVAYGTADGGSTWTPYPGTLAQVAQGSDGVLWGIDSDGHVWRWQ